MVLLECFHFLECQCKDQVGRRLQESYNFRRCSLRFEIWLPFLESDAYSSCITKVPKFPLVRGISDNPVVDETIKLIADKPSRNCPLVMIFFCND